MRQTDCKRLYASGREQQVTNRRRCRRLKKVAPQLDVGRLRNCQLHLVDAYRISIDRIDIRGYVVESANSVRANVTTNKSSSRANYVTRRCCFFVLKSGGGPALQAATGCQTAEPQASACSIKSCLPLPLRAAPHRLPAACDERHVANRLQAALCFQAANSR